MKKAKKIIFISLLILIISLCLINIFIPMNPIIVGEPVYYEIAYTENDFPSKLMFTDETGKNGSSINLKLPIQIEIFGTRIPLVKSFASDNISGIYWDPTGKALGVLYSTYYVNIRYPALILLDGESFSCPNDMDLYTNYSYPIHVVDRERIIINMGNFPNNRLVLYNMKDCKQESIYYDGSEVRVFAVSSQGWLAVNEVKNDELMLNVYDDNKKLVYSDNTVGYEYYLTWSKDGSKLVYNINVENDIDDVCMYDFVKEEKTIIGKSSAKVSFSPDGNKLIMEKNSNDLVILDLITLQENDFISGSNPDWRP